METRGHVAFVTLNRPDVLNAIHPPLRAELAEAIRRFREDSELWVAILTGAGDRAFCVGADLKWRVANEAAVRTRRPGAQLMSECWKPVIAAVNGYAVGGGLELAVDCDIVIAADHARFGLPEPRRGLMADAGGVQRLPRIIPLTVAMGLLLTGKLIDAAEAYRIGLVNEVVASEQLMAAAERWAQEILECSPLAVQATKQAALQGSTLPLDEALTRSYPLHEQLRQSEDFAEGPRAFAEKRRPVWKGR
jgi:enoyl-CoA hydratase/carnithine racemase